MPDIFPKGIADHLHAPVQCMEGYCTIHNPSPHHMREWTINIRESGMAERLCEHGIGHPDPDSIAWLKRSFGPDAEYFGIHGCDGCCNRDIHIVH